MSLDFVAEVWDALRTHIDFNERSDAADTMVNLLVENNYEADDIKSAFRGDKEIITALKNYVDEHDLEEDYEDYSDDDDYDDWQ
jgi:hypothetical protein